MNALDGCQIPCLPRFSEGPAEFEPQPLDKRIKRMLAKPWNYYVKKWLKFSLSKMKTLNSRQSIRSNPGVVVSDAPPVIGCKAGDLVRVRSVEEIQATLDSWNELKGCAFLVNMWQFCGTTQRVLQPMERFLDERDYKVKKCKGIVLLEGVICHGTPVFGRCDRCCHLFWRQEWLEKIDGQPA